MKTLLQINSVVNYGSTGRIAEDIGRIAIANGWESYIAFGRNVRASQSKLIRIGSDWDVKMHGFYTRMFDRHGFASTKATRELVKEIQEIRPTVIHLHNLHGYYLNISVLFKYLSTAGIPVVWTLHDCWAFTGHCAYFDYVGCEKWKTECFNCPQKKSYPSSLLMDNSKNNYYLKKQLFQSVENLTLVPVSNWLGDLIKFSFLQKYPIKIINNGIDIDTFTPTTINIVRERYGVNSNFIILGVANIWDTRKGLNDFIKLSNIIDQKMTILLVGLSKKQIKNLPKNIIGISRTESTQELAQLYSASSVFVNATWEDTFSTTNLESIACGTPVITYATGGCNEAISSKSGFIVPKGDIEGLYNAIKNVQSKGKQFFSENCVSRARMYYNKNEKFMEYLNLYNELLLK